MSLVLSRKFEQTVIIRHEQTGEEIRLTIGRKLPHRNQVRLIFDAPKGYTILRSELEPRKEVA